MEGLGVEDRLVFMLFISWWFNRQYERWIMSDSEIAFGELDRIRSSVLFTKPKWQPRAVMWTSGRGDMRP